MTEDNQEQPQEEENQEDSDESQDEEPAPVTDGEEPEPVTDQDSGSEEDSGDEQGAVRQVGVRARNNTVTETEFAEASEEEKKNIGVVYEDDVEEIREELESQEKVMMNIPDDSKGEDTRFHTVQINGYRIQIQRGVMVEVPRQVAELLADHFDIKHNLGKDLQGQNYRLDQADEETKEALNA